MKSSFTSPLVLFLAVALLSGCGGGSSSSGGSSSAANPRREMMQIQQELNAFAQEHDLTENEALLAAEAAFMAAAQEFNRTRRAHPELAPLFDLSDAAQDAMVSKKVAGDEAGYQEAMTRFREARQVLESKAAQLPEIQEAQQSLRAAEIASTRAMAEAAAGVNAAGRDLKERFDKVASKLE